MKIIAAFAIGLACVGALTTAPAQAQATRTFVSPTGSDASATCSLAAPCRTFAAAYALANAGGEIAVLGTAGYGTLTIGKAISIVNGGGFEAGIAVPSGGIGITINAGVSDAVSLRGLTIEGGGVGQTGIQFNTGKSLTLENCVIRHVTQNAFNFFPNASSSLLVSNTLVADNGNAGISVLPTGSNPVTAVFERVQSNNNAHGFDISGNGMASTGTINATVSDSVVFSNSQYGFNANTFPANAPTTLMVVRSVVAKNGTGFIVSGGGCSCAAIRIGQSAVTGNNTSWSASTGGTIVSYGDNYIDGNGDADPAPQTIVRK